MKEEDVNINLSYSYDVIKDYKTGKHLSIKEVAELLNDNCDKLILHNCNTDRFEIVKKTVTNGAITHERKKPYNDYMIDDKGVIVNVRTGKTLKGMKGIAEHLNWLSKTNSYVVHKDDEGKEYVEFVDFSIGYFDVKELCELCNAWENEDLDKVYKKVAEKKEKSSRKKEIPYIWDGRFLADHSTRKGFWLEDWVNGKVYYYRVKEHRDAIVGLLNSYTEEGRFIWYRAKCGNVIKDTVDDEVYVLGDSKHLCDIRDLLNWYDYSLYGERELPYRRQLM